MIRKEELERRLEAAEMQMLQLMDEISKLQTQLSKVNEESEIPDMPDFKSGEELFSVGSDLETVCNSFMNPSNKIDFNTFHTNTYAEEFRRKCLMIAMMLHCSWYVDRYYTPNWDNVLVEKYFVVFNHNLNKFQVQTQYGKEHGDVYFSTEEAAQKCADWMSEHWVD